MVPRPHLLERLQKAHDRCCVLVTAPAGSGKTILLRSWERKARARQVAVVWLDAREDGRLACALARRCRGALPGIQAWLPERLPEREDEALHCVAIAIVRAAAELQRPLVLVFDSLEAASDGAALQGLQPLLDYAPARLQCVLLSRTGVALSLGRLRASGQLLELGPADLQWPAAEAFAFFQSCAGPAEPTRIQCWQALAEGWALGLSTIAHAVHEGKADDALLQEVYPFLTGQVLAHLPARARQVAPALAAMEPFDAALAARLTGEPVARCEAWLADLAATGFLPQADERGAAGTWRFHAALGQMLRQGFAQQAPAKRRATHRMAAAHFSDRGMQWHAVHHAVAAGEQQRAADWVADWAVALFQSGQHERLAALLRLVPDEVARRHPRLRLWAAWLALLDQRFAQCRRTLRALQRDVQASDTAMLRRMSVLEGWLAIFQDDMQAAMAVFAQLRGRTSAVDELTLAGERNVLSWIHIYRNDYQRARDVQCGDPALEQAPRGTLFGTLSGRCLAGLSLALEGRMNAAERIYRDVLEQAEAGGEACADPAALAVGLLGETLYELDDLAGVRALESRLPDLQRRSLPDPLLRVMLAIIRTHAVLGDTERALRVDRQLQDHAREHGLDRLLSYALLEQLRLQLEHQDPAAAQTTWDEISRLRGAHEQAESTALSEVSMVADRAEILVHLYMGRLEVARTRIDALLDVSARRGRRRRVAALRFQRAAITRELGDAQSAAADALQGLRLGAQLGLVRSLLDAHPAVPELLDGALALQGHDMALAFHADRLRAAAGKGPLAAHVLGRAVAGRLDGATTLPEALSPREDDIVRLLAQALPNKEIARALGLSSETVKWHLRNIYGKLGVGTRYEALRLLRTAQELSPARPWVQR